MQGQKIGNRMLNQKEVATEEESNDLVDPPSLPLVVSQVVCHHLFSLYALLMSCPFQQPCYYSQKHESQGSATSSSTPYRHLVIQGFDAGSTSQLFKLVRVPDSEGVFKIHSSEYPSLVLSLPEGVCSSNTDLILLNDNSLDYQKWKIGSGGTIENVMCKGMVVDFQQAFNGQDTNIYLNEKNDNWSQKWSIKSNDVVLLEADGNSTQTWSPVFAEPGYDLALHPGFPGVLDSMSCLKVTTTHSSHAAGTVDIYVDSGNGYDEVTTSDRYERGEVVVDLCFDRIVGIRVRNTHGDGWMGSFQMSIDNKRTWTDLKCVDCTNDSTGDMPIVVDGDGNGSGTPSKCLNGNMCNIEVSMPYGASHCSFHN